MGRPVLASDVGGLVELVQHGVTGLVFRAESTEALVAEGARVGRDPRLRARLGEAARDYVERERSWIRIAPTCLTLYQELQATKESPRVVVGHAR